MLQLTTDTDHSPLWGLRRLGRGLGGRGDYQGVHRSGARPGRVKVRGLHMNSADQGHPDPVCDDDGDLRENASVSRCPRAVSGLPVFCQYEVRRQSNFSTLGVEGRQRGETWKLSVLHRSINHKVSPVACRYMLGWCLY